MGCTFILLNVRQLYPRESDMVVQSSCFPPYGYFVFVYADLATFVCTYVHKSMVINLNGY